MLQPRTAPTPVLDYQVIEVLWLGQGRASQEHAGIPDAPCVLSRGRLCCGYRPTVVAALAVYRFSQIQDAPDRETTLTPTAGVAQSKRAKHKKAMQSEEVRPATKALIEILHHKPNVYGINRSNWCYQNLADAYEKQYSQRMSTATVHRLLQAAGYRWKKSRKVLTSPDPHYREKSSWC